MSAPLGYRALAPDIIRAAEDCARAIAHAFERAPDASAERELRARFEFPRGRGVLTTEGAKAEHTSASALALLYLAPARSAGAGNLCANAHGCVAPCLAETSGRMRVSAARAARVRRTRALLADPFGFGTLLGAELVRFLRAARRRDALARPLVRLDGGSDLGIGWILARDRAEVSYHTRLFDYTKSLSRAEEAGALGYPIAFSATAPALPQALALARRARSAGAGASLALVVDVPRGAPLPQALADLPCIDGDATGEDWATLPSRARAGAAILLRYKGPRAALDRARRAGFVFRLEALARAAEGAQAC